MLLPLCTCGDLQSNIQLAYQKDIKELCEEFNIDIELMSRGIINNEEFNEAKRDIINFYTDPDRTCSRVHLMNFSDIVKIVGG